MSTCQCRINKYQGSGTSLCLKTPLMFPLAAKITTNSTRNASSAISFAPVAHAHTITFHKHIYIFFSSLSLWHFLNEYTFFHLSPFSTTNYFCLSLSFFILLGENSLFLTVIAWFQPLMIHISECIYLHKNINCMSCVYMCMHVIIIIIIGMIEERYNILISDSIVANEQ